MRNSAGDTSQRLDGGGQQPRTPTEGIGQLGYPLGGANRSEPYLDDRFVIRHRRHRLGAEELDAERRIGITG